jgi:DNA polymerase-3 subunit gamma/tau
VLKLTILSEDIIIKRLEEVFAAEGISPAPGVSAELARRARGGMRDALSLADQLLALVGNAPTLADAERLSGDGSEGIEKLIEHMLAGDKPSLMAALPDTEGGESELIASLLDHLRACLLAALCGPDTPVLQSLAAGDGDREALQQRGKQIGAARLELWLQELLHARERMRLLPTHGRLVLEVTLLDLCDAHGAVPLEQLAERLERLEGRLASGAPAPAQPAPSAGAAPPAPAPAPAPPRPRAPEVVAPKPPAAERPAPERPAAPQQNTPQQAAPQQERAARVRTNSTADAWAGFLVELKQRAGGLGELIERRGSLVQYGSGKAVVRLEKLASDEKAMISASRNRKLCSVAFEAAVGKPVDVDLQDSSTAAPGQQDAFTAGVKELFKGRIEN